MNFEKVEIYGFKSFADKAEIKFGDGITGIVGPNGCGKSNVADAIRWVLANNLLKPCVVQVCKTLFLVERKEENRFLIAKFRFTLITLQKCFLSTITKL